LNAPLVDFGGVDSIGIEEGGHGGRDPRARPRRTEREPEAQQRRLRRPRPRGRSQRL